MILVRHGESEFNVVFSQTRIDPGIPDPKLTPTGHRQARNAAAALAGYGITRVISSPYTRTLQTAVIIAEALGVALEIEPLVRERGFFVCDIGTPAGDLAAAWPQHEFGHLDEVWWIEDESDDALVARCDRFRERVVDHPAWPNLAVVAHWGFIRGLTGLQLGNGELVTYRLPDEAPQIVRTGG
ncbi:MAG: histidine phosphatase family protein [Alphaproteobacteria bacterium]|nr:histidine phosphatase family protein [Alphaproteobacteria bacterium]